MADSMIEYYTATATTIRNHRDNAIRYADDTRVNPDKAFIYGSVEYWETMAAEHNDRLTATQKTLDTYTEDQRVIDRALTGTAGVSDVEYLARRLAEVEEQLAHEVESRCDYDCSYCRDDE
jgi:hypothetical protein